MEGEKIPKDTSSALKRAKEIKVLAGKKLEEAAEELRAMIQFPGLEEEVAKKKDRMLKLYQDAEQTWEGKKYADVMKKAFEELERKSSVQIADANWCREKIDDFVRFLEVKFSPRLVEHDYRHNEHVAPARFYLLIKGTSFVFTLRLGDWPQTITLKRADRAFISTLVEPEKPGGKN
ncbi:MAG: hypothetical protein AAB792_02320 [Patescibacteria group bacterium]